MQYVEQNLVRHQVYDNVFVAPEKPKQAEQLAPQSPLGTVWTIAPVSPKKNKSPLKDHKQPSMVNQKEAQNAKPSVPKLDNKTK